MSSQQRPVIPRTVFRPRHSAQLQAGVKQARRDARTSGSELCTSRACTTRAHILLLFLHLINRLRRIASRRPVVGELTCEAII